MEFSEYKQYWLSAVHVIIFFAVLPWGRKVWMMADAIVLTAYGIANFILPEWIYGFQVDGTLDPFHIHLRRVGAVLVLGQVLFYYLTRKSRDVTVHTAILWSRVVAISALLVAEIYAETHYTSKKSQNMSKFHLYTVLPSYVFWLLGNLLYSLKIEDWGGYSEMNNRLTFHQRLDFVSVFLCAITLFAFPQWIMHPETTLNKLDSIHIHLGRCYAALLFGLVILSGRCANFLTTEDKKAYFTALIVQNLVVLACQVYAQVMFSEFAWYHVYFGIGGQILWTMNGVLGYLSAKNKYKYL